MTEDSVQLAKDGVAQAVQDVKHLTGMIRKIEELDGFNEEEFRYITFRKRLKEANGVLKEANDRLKIEKIELEIKKIKDEIEEIAKGAGFTGTEPRYTFLQDSLQEANVRLTEANYRLKIEMIELEIKKIELEIKKIASGAGFTGTEPRYTFLQERLQEANDRLQEANYRLKIEKIELEIKKIQDDIEKIVSGAGFTETQPRYIFLNQILKEANDRLQEANDSLMIKYIEAFQEKLEKMKCIEGFTESDPRYISLTASLTEAIERRKEARQFHLQLRTDEPSTPKRSILENVKLPEITKSLPAASKFGRATGEGCWKVILKRFVGQIDCHRCITIGPDPLPITLMHPVFAEFVQNCQSDTLSDESCTFANVLRQKMLEDYESEEEMAPVARGLLGKYLDVKLLVTKPFGSETDGSYHVNNHLILNLEVKLQPGSGCDPSMQNLAYFFKQLPDKISHQLPCLLLDISGPLLGIYGVMNTDDEHVICEPLCPILPLHDVDNDLIRPLVSRVCAALRIAIDSLKTMDPSGLSTFPYKTSSVQIDGEPITFRYVKRLERYVFLVEYSGADRSTYKAIAKFTKGYGKDVHEYCAKSGFAPKLLAYEEKLPANWSFVLMEYVEMEPISKMDRADRKKQLYHILQSLQSGGFVHGDLRHTNLCWNRAENRVILIDFDWSGKNGEKCYPCDMNPELDWPVGASTGKVLSFAHDAYWMKQWLD